MSREYELVAGLETHVELSTKTKIFCSCTTAFGSEPNTHCCPVCIGLPGTLPKLNRQVVRSAIRAGLALDCQISEISKMDRKNYVYPDLPKAYQISQFDKPLCRDGSMELSNGRVIRINRIHIEEDAGKLVHEQGDTFVDYNRGGVPLIEIVTEPDFRSIDEVKEYVERLQLTMKYLGVSDCKMEEGSLRCDVNISVRPKGSAAFGTRTEIKNMNSFTYIARAMEYEFSRQVELLEAGETVVQETLRYDVAAGVTESMRGKEDAQDYRYFRDPDLVTILTTGEEIEQLRASLPELPAQKAARFAGQYGLSPADAALLARYPRCADYFDEAAAGLAKPKTAANFLIGQVFSRLGSESAKEACAIPFDAKALHDLAALVEEGKINMGLAKSTLEKMLDSGKGPGELLSAADMEAVDDAKLTELCRAAIEADPKAVEGYLGGKEKALQALIGAVMRATRGRANAAAAEKVLKGLLQP
ncbi:MAG: Asp-tRNA(Asn)/Glu-tRNA(Gln) amidotransferase subunit GatB [Oscillospiraceae bacterium]|nr:Asp-tRNA(Asn)/Glu-tRNA(Gln) amidotransferase subunit GatB [Oscillospiraceae bacterium]